MEVFGDINGRREVRLGPGISGSIGPLAPERTLAAADRLGYPFVDTIGIRREGAILLRPSGLYLGGRFIEPPPRPWESAHYREGTA